MGKIKIGDVGGRCVMCHGKLILKNGKYGNFWGCENWPECPYTESTGKDYFPGLPNSPDDFAEDCPSDGEE